MLTIQIEHFDSVMHYRVGIKVVASPNASQAEVWVAYEKYPAGLVQKIFIFADLVELYFASPQYTKHIKLQTQ
ncbi:hypothetical protein [Microbulbifer sp. ZKSA002]|uniref:hypothetical protein n=1 Tax=Microbulbifer sp. ZKSA002 TaxID=3243388 RepID=UPI00403A31B4